MDHNYLAVVSVAISLIIGTLLGGISAWRLLKSRIAAAVTAAINQSTVEIARLQEKLCAEDEELQRDRALAQTYLAASSECQKELNSAREERAQLAERAGRVCGLEEQVNCLQAQLSEEKTRAAAATEQSMRLPNLEDQLESGRNEIKKLNQELAAAREQVGSSSSLLESHGNLIGQLRNELSDLTAKCERLTAEREDLHTELAKATTNVVAEQEKSTDRLAFLENAKEQLSNAFKSLASDILDQKAVRLADQSRENLGQILEPLKTKLGEFQTKVEQVHLQDIQGRATLGQEIRQLAALNQQLSHDAQNLATALKGSAKAQGNWGEMILVKLLEAAGLREGRDYELRPSYQRESGHRAQPDIVINLPSSRHLIVDSKVSLVDYSQYVNTEDDISRSEALARHLASMHRHINELSEKNYQNLCDLNSLDFVIMFVPIESAFAIGLAQDTSLWEKAWARNILLVSPSTLLFVLRTVAYLWQQEDQARNVQEIAHRGAELYNKLVGFVEDLDKLNDRLRQAKESFDNAYNKLSKGNGNVIRQAEMLKEMGVKPTKSLPSALIDSALEEEPALAP